MASDSRGHDGYIGTVKLQKLFKKQIKRKENVYGLAGFWEAGLLFMDWFESRDSALMTRLEKLSGETDFSVLIWDGKKLLHAGPFMRITPVNEEYYAAGSGACYAITALDCGKSAAQAVQMAIKRDPNSGGRIVTMRLEPKVKSP